MKSETTDDASRYILAVKYGFSDVRKAASPGVFEDIEKFCKRRGGELFEASENIGTVLFDLVNDYRDWTTHPKDQEHITQLRNILTYVDNPRLAVSFSCLPLLIFVGVGDKCKNKL
jgi:hypothetical protein